MSRKRAAKKLETSERGAVIVEDDRKGRPEAREVLLRNSPIPRSLAIILIVLAALGLVSSAVEDHRRSDDDHRRGIQNCQTLAQVKLRGDQGTAANAQLSKSLGDLLNAIDKRNNVAALKSLKDLQNYYAVRSIQASTLPPLPSAVIQDCQDGNLDGNG